MTPRPRTSSRPRVTWYGHSAIRVTSPSGTTILIDPWLDNPKAPAGATTIGADLLLVTHGHSDHVGNVVELARRTGAPVIAIHEVALFLKSRGVTTAQGMNKGGTVQVDGIRVTMVDARHSSGLDGGETVVAGGEAAGFVVRLEDGYCLYHAGDTSVFGDMKLIGDLYRPSVAFLPIGDLFTMGPEEAAMACELLKPRIVIGIHYGTFPALTGTPAALRKLLPPALRRRVRELEIGVETGLS